jgi:hypothetical protein
LGLRIDSIFASAQACLALIQSINGQVKGKYAPPTAWVRIVQLRILAGAHVEFPIRQIIF